MTSAENFCIRRFFLQGFAYRSSWTLCSGLAQGCLQLLYCLCRNSCTSGYEHKLVCHWMSSGIWESYRIDSHTIKPSIFKKKPALISLLLVCYVFENLRANHLLKLLHFFRVALFLTLFGTSHLLQLRYLMFQFICCINSFALGIQYSSHIFCGTKIYISSSINNLQNFQYHWLLT